VNCHPLLRGGRREKGYSHGLSTSQMHVMASICHTLFPFAPSEETSQHQQPLSPSVSHVPFPEEVIFQTLTSILYSMMHN